MGRRHLRAALVSTLVVLAVAWVPGAVAAGGADSVVGPWTSQWFVELGSAPSSDGTSQSKLDSERSSFKAAAKSAGISFTERFAYSTLFNGLAISTSDKGISEISKLDGVKAVYPVQTTSIDELDASPLSNMELIPDLQYAITMTGADIVQTSLGYTGKGVHVAVMDTGIDWNHPDLGGCFGFSCRVTNGWDFVGDDYNDDESDPAWQPVPHPDANPDDCQGHGTHVAGIVGANGAVKGVAPDVTFGAYRVFGCNGSTSDAVMLAALERIYKDGADVINMSIGDAFNNWPGTPTAQASSRLVQKGIVVVASIGNSGTEGIWAAGAPGVGEDVIGVASVDNLKSLLPSFTVSPDNLRIGYNNGSGSPTTPTSGTFPLTRTGTKTTPNDACVPAPAGSLAGKVVLVRRGTCTFIAKVNNVAAGGAAGVVLYNNAAGRFTAAVAGATIPVVSITQADGELLDGRIAAGPISLTWTPDSAPIANPTAGLLSSFTSYGMAADLTLKPDISAPGGLIRSTYPVEKGSYTVLSGTSMASPHVAGAAALFLQAHPKTKAGDLRSILQNNADPGRWSGSPGLGFLDIVGRQGAGLVDIDDAILATSFITPGKLSLGESVTSKAGHDAVFIQNTGSEAVTYALSHVDAVSPRRQSQVPLFEIGDSAVTFTQDDVAVTSVTVPAGEKVRLGVTVVPDATLPEGTLYGGYLVFTPGNGDEVMRVPYAGYIGDYQAIQASTATAQGFPWLARKTNIVIDGTGHIRANYTKQSAGAVFTLAATTLTTVPPSSTTRAGADVPFVVVHMNHQARNVRIEVFSTAGSKSLGTAFEQDYVSRNLYETPTVSQWDFVKTFPFDGTTRSGNKQVTLPDGQYYLVMTLTKAGADKSDPTETWTSPTFTIDRP
jgi:minor extracellular serine protease Vpr